MGVWHLIRDYVTTIFIRLSAVELDFVSSGVLVDDDDMLDPIDRIWQKKVLSQMTL